MTSRLLTLATVVTVALGAAAFAGATCSPQAGVQIAALVDQSDPARWMVYLEIVS